MKVKQIFFNNSLRNFSYMITFDDGAIFCIDPFNAKEVIDYLGSTKIKGIINTHDHCDHYSGNDELNKQNEGAIYAHPNAQIPSKTIGLEDNAVIYSCNEWELKAYYTPGHTMTHIALGLLKNAKMHALFTGDCFFNAGVGNCHNGGNPEVLYQTISDFFQNLSDDVLIYPGHEYLKRNLEFTLSVEKNNQEAKDFLNKISKIDSNSFFFVNSMKKEKEINSFLRLKNPEIQKNLQLDGASDKTIFIKLRELRNKW